MQPLLRTVEYAKYVMANIPQQFMDVLEKTKQNDNQKNDSADMLNGVDVKCARVNIGENAINMCVVQVNLRYSSSGKTENTYALLEAFSQGTLILEKLMRDLGVDRQKTSFTIKLTVRLTK